ncbi:hypothetical protein ACFW9X_03270 [Streptomyces sp. NPDC059466]|uniref:hypothetical protein n=1 Tax=Streptomyces sp. NPDC059466 TaxID=3346843 RepID=UPI0036C0DC9C
MSFDDITLLIIGMGFGVALMNFLHMRWDAQSRRSTAASRAARRQASGDLFHATFLGYRWKNRQQKFPISTHTYDGLGFEAPCAAPGYGTVCGATEYDHTETTWT